MKTILMFCFAVVILAAGGAFGSEEEFLGWTSATIRCAKTAEAGDVFCEINTVDKRWEKFVIQAFGKTHTLSATNLAKLEGFPLSSLRTSHEAGYERLGGHTIHFRFERTFYNPEKKLVTKIIYVSVTRNGVTVSERTQEH